MFPEGSPAPAPAEGSTAEPTPEPTPEPTAPPTGEPPATPDLSEALSGLGSRLESIEQRLPQQPEQPSGDFIDSLLGIGAEEEPQPGQPAGYAEPPAGYPQQQPQGEPGLPGDPGSEEEAIAQFRQILGDEIQARVEPYFVQEEANRRREALLGLVKQYPELDDPAIRTQIAQRLEPWAERYGRDVVTDPDVVLRVYQSIKAEAVASGESAAEADGGATLETGAGPSGAGEEQSIEEQYANALLGQRSGGDRFT